MISIGQLKHLLVVLPVVVAVLTGTPASATTYFVSVTGSDSNDGLTATTPLRNPQAAADRTVPGDFVAVMDGTYTADPSFWHQGVLLITRSGTAGRPITYMAYPGQHPVITTSGNRNVWDAVHIEASYINVAGFEVIGNAQNVTLDQANATAAAEEATFLASVAANHADPSKPIVYPGDPMTNGNCIFAFQSTHLIIKQNLVHDCSANGISAEVSDTVYIGANVVFNTSWWTVYDTSGINIHRAWSEGAGTGYRNFVVDNISHDNANTQAFYDHRYGGGVPTDGNGIIVDTNQSTNDGKAYPGRTLVEGNIVYNNGGSGIHTYLSAHVDLFNNTAYMNNTCPVPGSDCGAIDEGQIFANSSTDISIYNNVLYAPKGYWVYGNWQNTAVSEDNNIMFSPGGAVMIRNDYQLQAHDLTVDPQFNAAGMVGQSSASAAAAAYAASHPRDVLTALRLKKASQGRRHGTAMLDSGKRMLVTPKGIDGNKDGAIDSGALSAPNAS